ncbi:MAG TPA: hypothetical protein VEW93_03470 [Acidimicrobiales bacterium]|nr:hypothetical protein [Acidimicrobiales bacterium]
MSAADLAAVIGTVTALAVVAVLTVVVTRLARTVRDVAAALDEVRGEALPALREATEAVRRAGEETARVNEILDAAEAVSSRVDGASRAAYVALSKPVIKTAAAATGAQRAARKLRGRDEPPPRSR